MYVKCQNIQFVYAFVLYSRETYRKLFTPFIVWCVNLGMINCYIGRLTWAWRSHHHLHQIHPPSSPLSERPADQRVQQTAQMTTLLLDSMSTCLTNITTITPYHRCEQLVWCSSTVVIPLWNVTSFTTNVTLLLANKHSQFTQFNLCMNV